MASGACTHRDVREFDNLRCCMSCGETLHLWQLPQGSKHTATTNTHTSSQGLAHTYSDLRLTTGQSIRLIVLLPGQSADPICCTIATVNPYEERYDAVSYTWATEGEDYSKTGRIHCPDGVIPVTENCEAALRRLRLPSAPRQLWVDAICIDQTNIGERNHQVGLMNQIFQLASVVHICIQDSIHRYTECIHWLKPIEDWGDGTAITSSRPHEDVVIAQLEELFRRRYFSRVWYVYIYPLPNSLVHPFQAVFTNVACDCRVIQEIILAKALILHMNSEELVLDGTALLRLSRLGVRDTPFLMTTLVDRITRGASNHPGDPRPLIDYLKLSINASSSDPRDKIFGVHSLLHSGITEFLPVDYSLDYEQIFGLAVMLCIAECCTLKILMYASMPSTSNLESACTFGIEQFREFLLDCTLSKDNDSKRRFYTRDIPWHRLLFVQMLSSTTQTLNTVIVDSKIRGRMEPVSFVRQASNQFPFKQILPRLKLRAHLLDIAYESFREAQKSVDKDFRSRDLVDPNWRWLERMFQKPEDRELCIECVEQGSRPTRSVFDGAEYVRFVAAVAGRPIWSMFRTHYSMGYSTANHKAGDHVFAIDGVPEPFLLRQVRPGTYRIVGHCYLWAAGHLDYWNPGTYEGLWLDRPVNLGECTRMIEIY